MLSICQIGTLKFGDKVDEEINLTPLILLEGTKVRTVQEATSIYLFATAIPWIGNGRLPLVCPFRKPTTHSG